MTATHSLIGDNQGAFIPPAPLGSPDANGNFIGIRNAKIDPKLGALGDNGGQTPTMALLPGSPALNTSGASALTTDQRGPGFPRKIGAQVDMGPFEYDPSSGDTMPPAAPRNLRVN